MKKMLSWVFMAISLVAFNACNNSNNNQPDYKEPFKLILSELGDQNAVIVIDPKDTLATYYYICRPLEEVEGASLDSILAIMREEIDHRIEISAWEAKIADFLWQGIQLAPINNLSPKTDYVFYLLEIDTTGQFSGVFNSISFRTLEFQTTEDKNFEITGVLYDYTDREDPYFLITAEVPAENMIFHFDANSETLAGTFVTENFDDTHTFYRINDENGAFYSLEFRGDINTTDHTYIFEGVALGWDKVRYALRIVCPMN